VTRDGLATWLARAVTRIELGGAVTDTCERLADELLEGCVYEAIHRPGLAGDVAAVIQRQVLVLEEQKISVSSQGGAEHVARNLLVALPGLMARGG